MPCAVSPFAWVQGVTSLLGPNGAGKTTLLKCLVGLLTPRSGHIEVLGRRVSDRRQRASAQRLIGYVPQHAPMPGLIRVEDAVAYVGWLSGLSAAALGGRVETTLADLQLGDLRRRRVRSLSGGQRQRVSLATGLVHDPAVLVLDEPTAGLDPSQRLALRRIVKDVASARSVVVATHLVEDMQHLPGMVVVITDGSIRFTGSPAEFRALASRPEVDATASGSEFELAYDHMVRATSSVDG